MNQKGVDKIAAGKVSMMVGMIVQSTVQISSLVLNSMELDSLRLVWFAVLLVNAPLTVVAFLFCKETKPEGAAGEAGKTVVSSVVDEVRGYVTLFCGNGFLRALLLSGALATSAEAVASIEQSFYMAHLGATQARVAFVWWLETVFFVVFLGAADKVRQRLGVRRTWLLMFCSRGGLDFVTWPLLPAHMLVLPFKKYCKAFWSGAGGLQDAVSSGYFAPALMVKYLAMRKLAEHAASVIALPAYGYIFHTKTESYLVKLAPFTFQVCLRLLQFLVVFGFCWDAGDEGGISNSIEKLVKSA
eukprot:CAMPEP_0178381774 /NCGR_PEP_ID=MMETSP0689_2-20121128/6159_1 /TAXON_ID=160604 /ORGANISM="Amphidinium massartii, Strain CS-259" /LENGTH=299 /DNA_ID=CAMNT_0020001973 /DNA_START=148 /DNA_END=1043 /DNA_ORIENTATION=-